MKTTELMIGDWVLHFGEIARIVGIRIDNYNDASYFKINLHDTWYESGVDGIEPITLTPEILVKNGFEKKEDDDGQELYSLLLGEWAITYMSILGCPYLTIEDVLDYDRAHSVLNLKDSIYYVHQLQQALCFCGIEKEIVL